MAGERIVTNVVNDGQTVRYVRSLHEVSTADGMNLIMTRKQPIDQPVRSHVMLVHGLGQNRYTWTLTRRSLENYLVANGFQTFNIELRGHGLSRANGSTYPEAFETYLHQDMPAFVDAAARITGNEKIFYMGHSLGGSIAYCVGSRYQDRLAGVISIGGPFSMARGNRLLKAIARTGVSLGRFYPFPQLQPDVFYIDYIGLLASLGLGILDHPLYKIPLQIWHPGSIERDILEERILKGFDRTSFNVVKFFFEWGAKGKFLSSDGRIDFESAVLDLHAPILFVNGDRDLAVPKEAVMEAFEKAGSKDKTFKVFGGEKEGLHWGHVDLICGKHAPEITWPYMLDWMEKRLVPENGIKPASTRRKKIMKEQVQAP